MNFETFTTPSVIILFIGVMILFLSRNWRWAIAALGVMYLGVFGLVALSWPSDLAMVKLIAGWLAGSVLAITQINSTQQIDKIDQPASELIFWAFSAVLVIITSTSVATSFGDWLPVLNNSQGWGGIFLIGMGLLSLGFSNQGFRVSISLLTLMAGFEILYSAVEASTLVAGLLAVVNLGIALSGAYLMLIPKMKEQE